MTSDEGNQDAPLYRQLAAQLRAVIEGGWPGPNKNLPSERELAARFNMSRDTVRKALKLLEEHGVLYVDQGRGTFVAPASVRQMSRFLDSFSADARKRGVQSGQIILSLEQVPANMAVAGLLSIEPSQTITRLQRIRTIDGAPVGLHDAYLNLPDGASFSRADLEKTGSLYTLMTDRFGITPAEGLESLGAVSASVEEAAHLNVAAGAPLLMCERITLSERRRAVEYCVMRYVSSYRYTTRTNKFSQLNK